MNTYLFITYATSVIIIVTQFNLFISMFFTESSIYFDPYYMHFHNRKRVCDFRKWVKFIFKDDLHIAQQWELK